MMRLFSLGANSPLRALSRGSGLQAVRLSSATTMQIHQCRRNLDLGRYALRRSARRDLNPRPSAWEADTLPLSYSRPWPTDSNIIDHTQLQHGCQLLLRCFSYASHLSSLKVKLISAQRVTGPPSWVTGVCFQVLAVSWAAVSRTS